MKKPDPDEAKLFDYNQWPEFSAQLKGVVEHDEVVLADLHFVELTVVGQMATSRAFASGMYLCSTHVTIVDRISKGDGTPIPPGLEAFFTNLKALDNIERPLESCFCDIKNVTIHANGRAIIGFGPNTTLSLNATLPPEIERLPVIPDMDPTRIQTILENSGGRLQAF